MLNALSTVVHFILPMHLPESDHQEATLVPMERLPTGLQDHKAQALSPRLWPKVSPSFCFFFPRRLSHFQASSDSLKWEVSSGVRFPWVKGSRVGHILWASLQHDKCYLKRDQTRLLWEVEAVVFQVAGFYQAP